MADTDLRTDIRHWALKDWADRQQRDIDSLKATGQPYNPGMLESAWMKVSGYPKDLILQQSEIADPTMKGHGSVWTKSASGSPQESNQAEQIRIQALNQAKANALKQFKGSQMPDMSGWSELQQGKYPVKDQSWGQ